ncbi:hypothetical protein GCM10010124_04190 [Pilimelia terevasa]|uniref:Winged helix DNA-binding domain-containing protein n=1 Tax=Pilimelia terevasa TaxID=53372 RepID=A0A8J3BE34_9ACTN|nr:crosslink repair DNA glycosylase YcaQ family protein [Pilimelia terevasa]GGK14751.1 hypothetical protein GCM10010124_04190 [Pilimelia terevasa]
MGASTPGRDPDKTTRRPAPQPTTRRPAAGRAGGGATPTVTRAQVLAYRWRRQQLAADTAAADPDLLDFGIQDTGPDGAGWAVHLRGGTAPDAAAHFLAWTLRGAPHLYRRADAAAVTTATAPLSELDAGKRIFDANRALKAAGIPALEALARVAEAARAVVTAGTPKGRLSATLTDRLPEPYLRDCRPCQAVHPDEMLFRLAMLPAALELTADTSPPVLRRIPKLRARLLATLGDQAAPRVDVIRNYLRFYGPATAREAAAFTDSPVREVQRCWPADAVAVRVRDDPRAALYALAGDLPDLLAAAPTRGELRLAGPYDAFLQGRDRDLLVPDGSRHRTLWAVIGRPGGILLDGEVAGTWRPRTTGRRLALAVDWWRPATPTLRTLLAAEGERLAAYRGVSFAGAAG